MYPGTTPRDMKRSDIKAMYFRIIPRRRHLVNNGLDSHVLTPSGLQAGVRGALHQLSTMTAVW